MPFRVDFARIDQNDFNVLSVSSYGTSWLAPYFLPLFRVNIHTGGHLEENQVGVDELGDGFLALGDYVYMIMLILSNSHWGCIHCLHNLFFFVIYYFLFFVLFLMQR